jgi:hypothetical protein
VGVGSEPAAFRLRSNLGWYAVDDYSYTLTKLIADCRMQQINRGGIAVRPGHGAS